MVKPLSMNAPRSDPKVEGTKRQQDRARVFLALSSLTMNIKPYDFIDILADVAGINARDPVGRQQGARVREEWQRLANVLELYLKT